MEVKDFENLLSDFGQELNNMDFFLLQAAGPIVDKMKSKSPVRTGALKRSISSIVSNNKMEINMLVYGAFQNYGVNGTQNNPAKQVQFGIQPRPRVEPFYSFKKRRFGLVPRDFFDIDNISDEVANFLADKLIERI